MSLSARQGTLSADAQREEARIEQLNAQTTKVRGSIDQKALARVIASAKEANAIIDQRTFSWTELFNHLESTLPTGVMLTPVRPRIDKDELRIELTVLGREVEQIDDFIEKLEATGAFSGVHDRRGDRDGERRDRSAHRGPLQSGVADAGGVMKMLHGVDLGRIYREKRRLILPLAILAVANLAALLLIVYPLSRRVAATEQRAQDSATRLVARDAGVSRGACDARRPRAHGQAVGTVLCRGAAERSDGGAAHHVSEAGAARARRRPALRATQLRHQYGRQGERADGDGDRGAAAR